MSALHERDIEDTPRNIWDQLFYDFPDAHGIEDAQCTTSTRTPGGSCQCLPVCARCGIGPHMGVHLEAWPIHHPYDHAFVAPDPGIHGDLPEPVLTALAPASAVLGSPSFTLHVRGTGFAPGSVIVFAGHDEPTTRVSDTEVTTGVDMSVWVGPDPAISVVVRNPDGQLSNTLLFAFTAPAARTPDQHPLPSLRRGGL